MEEFDIDINAIKVGDWITYPSAGGHWYQVTKILNSQKKFVINKDKDPNAFLWSMSISGVRTGLSCAVCEEGVDALWPDVDYLCRRCRSISARSSAELERVVSAHKGGGSNPSGRA